MRLNQLTENTTDLDDAGSIITLMSTQSAISQEKAEEVLKWMKENGYRFKVNAASTQIYSGRQSAVGRKYLNIISSTFENGFKTWKGRLQRAKALTFLHSAGFRISSSILDVQADRSDDEQGSRKNVGLPHVYFW